MRRDSRRDRQRRRLYEERKRRRKRSSIATAIAVVLIVIAVFAVAAGAFAAVRALIQEKETVAREEGQMQQQDEDASADAEEEIIQEPVEEPYPSDIVITIPFGEENETLTGDTIDSWMTSRLPSYVVDEEKVAEYVAELAAAHNTMYTYHPFVTATGEEITIKGGTYGWKLDNEAVTQALVEAIYGMTSVTVEPIFSQEAASFTYPDYGDSYVEVNLTAQKVYLFEDGECILSSDVVTGDDRDESTHTTDGIWKIEYLDLNAKLSGAEYQTPVEFWMPFNGNIGLHDALWRSEFGNNIYKTNGSHGCVNMPYEVAKTIYQHVQAGTPVIVYYLEGSESSDTTTQSDSQIAAAIEDTIDRVGSVEELTKDRYERLYYAEWLYKRLNSSRKALVSSEAKQKLDALKEAYKEQTGKELVIEELK